MKIQAIPITPAPGVSSAKSVEESSAETHEAQEAGNAPAEIVMLTVSGPIDAGDPIVARARELIRQTTGSDTMIESFDWAVENDAVVTDEE